MCMHTSDMQLLAAARARTCLRALSPLLLALSWMHACGLACGREAVCRDRMAGEGLRCRRAPTNHLRHMQTLTDPGLAARPGLGLGSAETGGMPWALSPCVCLHDHLLTLCVLV